ncbi:hypothetical protein AAGS61_01735 [Lysinibacillus sp. KU-BSD001]|uniref:hypothetical protein n=1 Tax=Lysinibacillus sp. KU-BSD001 TaxID=3141328 RepID=UPI0036E2CEE4
MLEKVKERLVALGVTLSNEPTSTDDYLLTFAVNKTTDHIKNQTNLDAIPQGLEHVAIDMAVGEFLFTKKSMGLLSVDTLNFEEVAKRVKDGDTDVEFAVDAKSTPEARFNAFITYLQHNEVDFVKYRVLTW